MAEYRTTASNLGGQKRITPSCLQAPGALAERLNPASRRARLQRPLAYGVAELGRRFVGRTGLELLRDSEMKRPIFLLIAALCSLASDGAVAQSSSERTLSVRNQDATIHVTLAGQGKAIVFIPSLGRGAEDFDDLSGRMVAAGFQSIRPQPRGIDGSSGSLNEITLRDLAGDIAAVIDSVHAGPAIVIAHAFGARVARVLVTDRPDLVSQVILLAAGSQRATSAETWATGLRIFDTTASEQQRIASVSAFFAKGNDARVWAGGWYLDVAAAQRAAGQRTSEEEWWSDGRVPILALQGTDDILTLSENARRFAATHSDRVTLVTIPNAGHAMLPEQPKAIADSILSHLRR